MITLQNFHEVRLPSSIEVGAAGGPSFKTTVISLSKGDETRNMEWSLEQNSWEIGYGLQDEADLNILRNFFYARRGRKFGFRFKDWLDFSVVTGYQFTTDGTTTTFQVIKRYIDAGEHYDRRLLKIVTGTVSLFDDTFPTSDYSIDLNTGWVTLGGTLAATIGHVITATLEFDIPVRFDIDNQDARVRSARIFDWQGIPIVEVKF